MNPVNLSGSAFQGNVNKAAMLCIGTGVIMAIAGMALNQSAIIPAYLVGAMYVVGVVRLSQGVCVRAVWGAVTLTQT